MVRALEADLSALRSRPTTAPGARPEPSEVDLPALPEAIARRDRAPLPETDAVIVDADIEPETNEVDVRSLFEQGSGASAPRDPQPSGPSAFVPETPVAAADAPPGAAIPPIDLLVNDGADADVLDDDAFFATLRDAVHDDAPLGPRDENEVTGNHQFFDQDADRGAFRDVFRRRR
jgi:hypothetical protein